MKERSSLNKRIVYLYPEVEGKENFVCWGFSKETISLKKNNEIKAKIKEALQLIRDHQNPWVKNRSFSVYLGEDNKSSWVALPRELSAKALKIFAVKLAEVNLDYKMVITSFQNPFSGKLPFEPVISYDRGFIFDSSRIEQKLAIQSISNI